MMVSVLIATRDRAPLLAATLDALCRQTPPGCPFEIIVADNASTDDTPAVVAAAARRSAAPVFYLRETRSGKSNALNTAVSHARGDLLVLTDDDVLPADDWLAAYVRVFAETDADYAAGRIFPLWEAPPPPWMSPALYGVLAVADGGAHRVRLSHAGNDDIMPLGANMAVRRYVVDRIGGWDPGLGKLQGTLRTGEDHDFALRMARAGFAGVYEPAAAVRHRVASNRLRLAYFQRWFYDNGGIEARLEREYPLTPYYLLGVPRYLWRQAARDVLRTISSIVRWDLKSIVAGEMRLAWFAGYLRGRWTHRQRRPRESVAEISAPGA